MAFAATEVIQSFPPIADEHSRILILGSMPGPASLQKREYYGHAQNAFWNILERCFAKRFSNYEDKVNLLLKKKIALWDVLASCRRAGAGDAAINGAKPNDIFGFLSNHARVEKILLNGALAKYG